MYEVFELRPYLRFPARSAAGHLALSRSTITAYNARPAEVLKGRMMRVHANAITLQKVMGTAPSKPRSNSRQANQDEDRIWGIVDERLDHHIELAPEDPAAAAKAQELKAWLLGDGMGWLKHRFREQWAESEAKIGAVDEPDASAQKSALEELVGAKFVAALRSRHAAFGAALGITEPAPEAQERKVREATRELRSALLNYVQGIGGLVDFQEPETVQHARALLAPIDSFRAALPQPGQADDGEAEETAEAPELPIPDPE